MRRRSPAYNLPVPYLSSKTNPPSVATIWHQLGIVYQDAGQYDPAEAAYRQSLEIKTRRGDLSGQASSLTSVGQSLQRLSESTGGGRDLLPAGG